MVITASEIVAPIRPSNCEECPFKSRTVGQKGPVDSPFVIVGESPGNNEVREGYPFVGDSGTLVDSVLKGTEAYWLNAIQCLPPKSKNPTKMQRACRACASRLHEEIAKYPRKVILALGNGAMWGLTSDYDLKITQIRGRIFDSPLAEKGIVASVHPAYLLRGGGSSKLFKRDILSAIDLLDDKPRQKYIEAECVVLETAAQVEDLIWEASEAEYIAADIETSSFDYLDGYLLSQGFCMDPRKAYIVPPHLFQYLGPIYNPKVVSARWIWHGGKFDVGWLRYESERPDLEQLREWHEENKLIECILHHISVGGEREGYEVARVDEDTMLLSYAIEETGGIHDLEQVAFNLLNAPNWKGVIDSHLPKKGASYANVPPDVLYKYQAKDLGSTLQCFHKMRYKVAADPKLEKLYTTLLIPGSEVLVELERNGMLISMEKIADNKIWYEAEIKEAKAAVSVISQEVLGNDINPGSWQQVQKLLYVGGLDLANGRILSTNKDILNAMDPHPAIDAILEYRVLAKQFGTYVEGIEKRISPDGRAHSNFLLHGTTTGRLASRDPNLQNIAREERIKTQFIAADGKEYLELDLNQAELRSLACLSKDRNLCRIYEDAKESIHKVVSRKFFGDDYDHEEYMRAKAVTFGIVYGREAFSLAREFKISVREAQRYIDGWFGEFPEAKDFIDKCRAAPMAGKILQTCFGRKRRFGVVSRDKAHDVENQAANFPHQSIASDITLRGAIEANPTIKRWNVMLINLVHDSHLMELDSDEGLIEETRLYVKGVLEAIPPRWGLTRIPFIADYKRGKDWGALKEPS